MGIPKFVEEMEEKANKLLQELQEDSTLEQQEVEQSEGIPAEDYKQAPKSDSASNLQNYNENTVGNNSQEKLLEEIETWKHKYEVLQYKYNAEVPRMAEEIRQLKEQINELSKSNSNTTTNTVPESLESFKEEYPEIYEAMETMMSARMNNIMQKYIDEINKLKSELGSKVERTESKTREAFLARMDKELPEWRNINVDPKFIEWLSVPDKYTGIQKLQLLRKAWDDMDFDRSIVFFKDYIAENSSTKKPPTFPNKSNVSGTTTESDTPISPQDITKLSRRIQQLINEQKYEEANKLEKKLDEILKSKINNQ